MAIQVHTPVGCSILFSLVLNEECRFGICLYRYAMEVAGAGYFGFNRGVVSSGQYKIIGVVLDGDRFSGLL